MVALWVGFIASMLYTLEFALYLMRLQCSLKSTLKKDDTVKIQREIVVFHYLSSAISATIIGITTKTAPPTNPVKKRDVYK